MADVQIVGAKAVLRAIQAGIMNNERPTYSTVAALMNRPKSHARAIAQMCDLLDAAACLAGVPLLALVAVRDDSGNINPKAWKQEYGARREAIINRSKNHKFSTADFLAISRSLDDLGQRGNRRAWEYVNGLYPGDLLYRRATGAYADATTDAIEDLGADIPDRARTVSWSYARDPEVRAAVLRRANGTCEFCGELGFLKPDGTRYLESHHIIALADEGAERVTNVIAVCANDHREAHFGARFEDIEKAMIAKLKVLTA